MKRFSILAYLSLSLSTACTTTQLDTKSELKLEHKAMGFSIPYVSTADKSILGPNWRDTTEQNRGNFSADYTDEFAQSKFSRRKSMDLPKYERIYENKKNAGYIYFTALPLAENIREKELPVLLKNMVENLAQTRFLFDKPERNQSRFKFVTKISEKNSLSGAGIAEGLSAQIEIANSDQLNMDSSNRFKRMKIALIKPTRGWKFESQTKIAENKWETIAKYQPSLLILVYENQPDYFEAHEEEFDNLVKSIQFPI